MSDNEQGNENSETVSDIVEAMRYGTIPKHRTDHELLAIYADRIEAAWKRERATVEADALSAGGLVEAIRGGGRSGEMRNLYDETVECLAEHNKSLDDVVFVAGNGHEIALNNFIEIARAYDYNEGYGGNEVPMYIIVVGTDWWIERHEYYGAEWWEYKTFRPSFYC